MGYDRTATLQDRKHQREILAASRVAKPAASARLALDFMLGKTTRPETERWASARGGTCRKLRIAYESECVGRFYSSESSTLWLEFDADSRLVSLRGIEEYRSPSLALALFNHIQTELPGDAQLGAGRNQKPSAAYLAGGLFRQSAVSAEFRDYLATARITNMGKSFAVTQDYAALE